MRVFVSGEWGGEGGVGDSGLIISIYLLQQFLKASFQ